MVIVRLTNEEYIQLILWSRSTIRNLNVKASDSVYAPELLAVVKKASEQLGLQFDDWRLTC